MQPENFSSNLNDKDKFYYSQTIIDKITKIKEVVEVDVLNLNSIIEEELPEGIVHFIKIDTEGKDLDIIKSLSDDNFIKLCFTLYKNSPFVFGILYTLLSLNKFLAFI